MIVPTPHTGRVSIQETECTHPRIGVRGVCMGRAWGTIYMWGEWGSPSLYMITGSFQRPHRPPHTSPHGARHA
jgi:hypothetical protein